MAGCNLAIKTPNTGGVIKKIIKKLALQIKTMLYL